MLTASALVLLMTPGLSFFYGGMVGLQERGLDDAPERHRAGGRSASSGSSSGSAWRSATTSAWADRQPADLLLVRRRRRGDPPRLSPTVPLLIFALFQLKFAIITPALITGSFAERVRFSSYLLFMVLFSLFIYCPLAHWTWHPDGFLNKWGVKDFAGGTVVHMSAGWAALAGALLLGRRQVPPARRKPTTRPISRIVLLGTGMLWFGWFGFNAGSALARPTARRPWPSRTTNTASAAAMLGWIFFDWMRGQKALGAGGLHRRGGRPGGDHPGGRVRDGPREHGDRPGGQRDQQPGRPLEDQVDARRHPRRLPLPRRRRDGRDARYRHLRRQGVGRPRARPTTFLYHLLALVIVSAFTFFGSLILFKVTDLIIPLRVTEDQERRARPLPARGDRPLLRPRRDRASRAVLGNRRRSRPGTPRHSGALAKPA